VDGHRASESEKCGVIEIDGGELVWLGLVSIWECAVLVRCI